VHPSSRRTRPRRRRRREEDPGRRHDDHVGPRGASQPRLRHRPRSSRPPSRTQRTTRSPSGVGGTTVVRVHARHSGRSEGALAAHRPLRRPG
jgi:hypothetical protein